MKQSTKITLSIIVLILAILSISTSIAIAYFYGGNDNETALQEKRDNPKTSSNSSIEIVGQNVAYAAELTTDTYYVSESTTANTSTDKISTDVPASSDSEEFSSSKNEEVGSTIISTKETSKEVEVEPEKFEFDWSTGQVLDYVLQIAHVTGDQVDINIDDSGRYVRVYIPLKSGEQATTGMRSTFTFDRKDGSII